MKKFAFTLAMLAAATSLTGCIIQTPAPVAAPVVAAPAAAPNLPNVLTYRCPLNMTFEIIVPQDDAGRVRIKNGGLDMGQVIVGGDEKNITLSYTAITDDNKAYDVIFVLQTANKFETMYASTWPMKGKSKKPEHEMTCVLTNAK